MSNELSNYRLDEFMAKVPVRPLDIMLVGVTGAGKSSTIDALIGSEAAKIGHGVNPETQDFSSYFLNDYVRLWDTPGIGDSPKKDEKYLQKITEYLNITCGSKSIEVGFSKVRSNCCNDDSKIIKPSEREISVSAVPERHSDRLTLSVNLYSKNGLSSKYPSQVTLSDFELNREFLNGMTLGVYTGFVYLKSGRHQINASDSRCYDDVNLEIVRSGWYLVTADLAHRCIKAVRYGDILRVSGYWHGELKMNSQGKYTGIITKGNDWDFYLEDENGQKYGTYAGWNQFSFGVADGDYNHFWLEPKGNAYIEIDPYKHTWECVYENSLLMISKDNSSSAVLMYDDLTQSYCSNIKINTDFRNYYLKGINSEKSGFVIYENDGMSYRQQHKPCYLIDMVLVVIDGSRRELGGIFKLLNQTILNNIDDNRIIFAINQADVAMSGRHWSNGRPDNVLIGYLNDQINSFQHRIESEIHRKIHRPICYSASQEYNVKALLDCILDNMSDCERQTKL